MSVRDLRDTDTFRRVQAFFDKAYATGSGEPFDLADLAVAPLCLVGVAAWASGNGTLLNACCERLGQLDPAYPMGRLLSDVSRRALPPAWWDAMADGLRSDLGLDP